MTRYSLEVRGRTVRMVFEHKARESDPGRLPPSVRRDIELLEEIQQVWDENFRVYERSIEPDSLDMTNS
jgi:hypothetical protein